MHFLKAVRKQSWHLGDTCFSQDSCEIQMYRGSIESQGDDLQTELLASFTDSLYSGIQELGRATVGIQIDDVIPLLLPPHLIHQHARKTFQGLKQKGEEIRKQTNSHLRKNC